MSETSEAKKALFPNIFQRMAAVMAEAGYIQKTGQAPQAAGGYSYVKHDDVVAKLRPLLVKHGIGIACSLDNHVCDKLTGRDRAGNERTILFSTVIVKTSFVNTDKPEDRIEVLMPGYGLDTQDKSVGKAISYAVKYTLLKNFLMESGDSEDVEAESIDVSPAQRAVPEKSASPADELRKLVMAWSNCPAEDCKGNVGLVFKKLEIPAGRIPAAKVKEAIEWCKKLMSENWNFQEAVAFAAERAG